MSEWLDIVDENDEVVGRAPRWKIHKENLLHRSTHIALFNSQGQVFVQLRSLRKDNDAGLWDTSAAGHVDSGESYLACAVRELFEELGVRVGEDELVRAGCLQPEARNGFEFTKVYTVVSDQALVLQADEIDDGRWLGAAELDHWIARQQHVFTEAFQTIWPLVRP
ncbi:MAG: NUDIX domain-containing protein [Granulosicoccus sp.]|nr:NUDIX domain-containing protein [Granulosicoccus sp.]